ncbi:NAD-dependent epimerase/dehydratase family protein [Pseudonocardia spinosispora]|uniref:NAD-dependent epimerase/dehydratase family protein n=1 Tax=Pseudonocardia spinosispora TaxID=103441 RepID=UPI00146F9C5D|nr:NAD-dependent epimerase/dehydratase family protein [Pseudonocardia spinosispora]
MTGASGYLGRALVRALADAGHEPVAPARADIGDPAVYGGADAVCHLAGLAQARASWDRPLDFFDVNVGGTTSVLRAMAAARVGTLVFASTAAIYGAPAEQPMSERLPDDPPHPYASSKAVAETVIGWEVARRGLAATVLRLSNLAGGADLDESRLLPRVLAAARSGEPITVNGDGRAVRDYLHVSDAAEAFVAALHTPGPPGVTRRYTIGSGVGSSVTEVIAAVERVTGRVVAVTHGPPADEPPALVCDPTLAMTELGWRPRRATVPDILRD